MGRVAASVVAAEAGELMYAGDFGRKVDQRIALWNQAEQAGMGAQAYRQARAQSVGAHLEAARAVLRSLGTSGSTHISRDYDGDIDLESRPATAARLPRLFGARPAGDLVGFKVDLDALEMAVPDQGMRADAAARRVVAAEARSLLRPSDFQARVDSRLRLWEVAAEQSTSEAEYRAAKALWIAAEALPKPPPLPPGKRTPYGHLGWQGPRRQAPGLVGCRADWEDTGLGADTAQTEIRPAAQRIVAVEAGGLICPKQFALRVELREALWEEAEDLGLDKEAYRQLRDTLVALADAPRFDRAALRRHVEHVALGGEVGDGTKLRPGPEKRPSSPVPEPYRKRPPRPH